MNTLAGAVLTALVIVAFNNFRNGTLSQWAKAKFLNQGTGGPSSTVPTGGIPAPIPAMLDQWIDPATKSDWRASFEGE